MGTSVYAPLLLYPCLIIAWGSQALSQVPAKLSNPEPGEPAARWIELAERILVCGRLFRAELTRRAGRWRLSESEFSLLLACRKAPTAGLSQKELAAILAASPSAVSGLVEQLRRAGLLDGHRAEADRRRQLWRLSSAGRARVQAVLADLADWAARLDEQLGAVDRSDLIRLLEQLAEMLRVGVRNHRSSGPLPKPYDFQIVQHDANREGAA